MFTAKSLPDKIAFGWELFSDAQRNGIAKRFCRIGFNESSHNASAFGGQTQSVCE
jgi:hypothetical protein